MVTNTKWYWILKTVWLSNRGLKCRVIRKSGRLLYLKKMLPPHNQSAPEVAESEGISQATLYNWRNQAKQQGAPVPGNGKTSDRWSAEAKLAVVIETAALSESRLSEYCRQKGLYPEQVREWKAACLQGQRTTTEHCQQEREQSKRDKKEIRAIKIPGASPLYSTHCFR